MSYNRPTVEPTEKPASHGGVEYSHPAFGAISASRVSGGRNVRRKLKEAMELVQKVAATFPESLRNLMPVCDRFPTSKDKPMREVILYQIQYSDNWGELEKIVGNTGAWEKVSEEDWPILKKYCERNDIRIIERKSVVDVMKQAAQIVEEEKVRMARCAAADALREEKRKAKELERKKKQLAKLQAELGTSVVKGIESRPGE